MVRIDLAIELRYEVKAPGADFILNIHAAQTRSQTVLQERLQISQAVAHQLDTDPSTQNRYLRLSAHPGELRVAYAAQLEIEHYISPPEQVAEIPVSNLPPKVLPYLYPSRYCQSDCLGSLVMAEFGGLRRGYSRVLAIQDWVRQHVSFTQNTTTSATSALDTLNQRAGVCRDFAHLMIALCRALSIPARFTTGTDYGADPALGPPDFHAYVEVYLGHRWYIFDPSNTAIPMAFVRLGTGRDAADVAFATLFGNVNAPPPHIVAQASTDATGAWTLPYRCKEALSTDPGI